jgi:hypothetical protein
MWTLAKDARMKVFDEAAWPLSYVTGWIIERDSERAEPYADPMFDGWRAWRQSQMDSVAFGSVFVTPADRATPAWRELLDALLNAKIVATGRPLTFRTIVDDRPQPSKVVPGLFYGPKGPYRVVDRVGVREPVPPMAWVDAVSPITGPANYESVMLLKRDVIDQWRVTVKTVDSRWRGRPSDKKKRVIEQMVRDLRAGELRGDELQKTLADKYGVARKTAKEALDNAMLQIQSKIIRK